MLWVPHSSFLEWKGPGHVHRLRWGVEVLKLMTDRFWGSDSRGGDFKIKCKYWGGIFRLQQWMSKPDGLLYPSKDLKVQREAQTSHRTLEIGRGLRRIPGAALPSPLYFPGS